jgi:DNA-directed RNA polymerase subunit M/transcription elongation factor TFIIS
MGKCSVCGNKILYNAFRRIKGVIYCFKCKPEERISKKLADTVTDAKLSFDEFKDAMKETAIVAVNENLAKELGEPMKITIEPKVCKYCGAKSSSEWLKMLNGEWCCKKRACRKKADIRYDQDIKQAEE